VRGWRGFVVLVAAIATANAVAAVGELGPPEAPDHVMVSDIGGGRALVSWRDRSEDETGFTIERDPLFTGAMVVVVGNSYIDGCGDGRFRYRVRAYGAGGASGFSKWADGVISSGSAGNWLVPGHEQGEGWTRLAPSADSRLVYVSSSRGSDRNSGLSEAEPKATLAAGLALLRQGYPDWLLLRRGDRFEGRISWGVSGRGTEAPAVLTSYGEGPRPLVRTGSDHGFFSSGPTAMDHVAVVGIHFQAHTWAGDRPPGHDPSGIGITRPGTNFLLEDCLVEKYANNVCIQGFPGVRRETRIRRNVLVDPLRLDKNNGSTNIFMDQYDGVLIEENVLDNSLEHEEGGAMLSHNIYLAENNPPAGVVVRRNIAHNGGRTNYNIRPGGLIEDNLSIRGAMGVTMGIGSAKTMATGTIRRNVLIESRDNQNGQPLGLGISIKRAEGVEISENLIANSTDGTYHVAIVVNEDCGEVEVRGNIVRSWTDAQPPTWGMETFAVTAPTRGRCRFVDNELQQPCDAVLVAHVNPRSWTFSGNRYFTQRAAGARFKRGESAFGFEEWGALSGEGTAGEGRVEYADPGRTVGMYAATLGLEETTLSFLKAAREQSRENWRAEYTAEAVNRYMREGFEHAQRVGESGTDAAARR
jgi:hypothetical protein